LIQKDDINRMCLAHRSQIAVAKGIHQNLTRCVPHLPLSDMLTAPPSGSSFSKQYGSFNLAKMQTWLRGAKISQ
jgi:hypothetical protein